MMAATLKTMGKVVLKSVGALGSLSSLKKTIFL